MATAQQYEPHLCFIDARGAMRPTRDSHKAHEKDEASELSELNRLSQDAGELTHVD